MRHLIYCTWLFRNRVLVDTSYADSANRPIVMSQRRPYVTDPSVSTMSDKTHEILEDENDQLIDEMAHKINALKKVSIDIGDEVRGQNRFLGKMDEEFDSAGGLLASSMKRVKNMGKAGHNRWMCYMMIFIILVFFLCYYIISWRNS